jgi:hypothetical protein
VAGATICGQVRGLSEPGDVALLRVERCPGGTIERAISSCVVAPQDGQSPFELTVPPDTPTGFAGERCQLGFAVRAHSRLSGRRRERVVVPVKILGGDSRVHEANHLFDRVIASFPARHFHLEVAEARLEGGGRIEGRIHAHDHLPRTLEVIARCYETWRTNFRLRNRRHPPLWRDKSLWQNTITVTCEADRRWHPFAFDIPTGLPPAVEGHIMGWRYEIEARHKSRVGLAERAVVTPLRFDIAAQSEISRLPQS